MNTKLCLWSALLCFAWCVTFPGFSATLVVSNLNDAGPGSLRQAIADAADSDTIAFDVVGTIVLTSGALEITNNLSIDGRGAEPLAVSGNNNSRVFEIRHNTTVSISGLTIFAGRAPSGLYSSSCNDVYQADGHHGGGIHNAGQLLLVSCTIKDNSAGDGSPYFCGRAFNGTYGAKGGSGGGIYNEGALTAIACTFSGNSAGRGGNGGTLDNWNGTSGAAHGGDGGAGGGVYNSGMMWLTNCTISGNASGAGGVGGWSGYPHYQLGANGLGGDGGGICNSGVLTIAACTVAENRARIGGGIRNAHSKSITELHNTLVASNIGGSPDLGGTFVSHGHNLVTRVDGAQGLAHGIKSDLLGSVAQPLHPLLGALQDNGGRTFTMALLHGSPALGTGDAALTIEPNNLHTDQRGFPRNAMGMDIGAFACQPLTAAPMLTVAAGALTEEFQIEFNSNTPGASFTVFGTTNSLLPFTNWTILGGAVRVSEGHFRYTVSHFLADQNGFFRISSP